MVTEEIEGMKKSIVGVSLMEIFVFSALFRPFITYEKKRPMIRSIPVHIDPETTCTYSRK